MEERTPKGPATSREAVEGGRLSQVLSLLFTPLLILSSSHALYLGNQAEFDYEVAVLVPFWGAAVLVFAAGLVLLRQQKLRLGRRLLWAYHLAGVFWLLYGFLRAIEAGAHFLRWLLDTGPATVVVLAGFAAAVLAVGRRPLRMVVPGLAWLGVVLLGAEIVGFVSRPRPQHTVVPVPDLPAARPDLGNIYHLILDAYQAELFDETLDPDLAEALEGFVRFPAARSLEKGTVRSLSTVLTGRRLPSRPLDAPLSDALGSERSLVSRLRAAGYVAVASVPLGLYPDDMDAFHRVYYQNTGVVPVQFRHAKVFRELWFLAVLPRAVSERLIDLGWLEFHGQDLRALRERRLSTYTQPLSARVASRRVIANERALASGGRYTWIHLLLPHSPYRLDRNCTALGTMTDPLEQTRCANRILREFLVALKDLGRFDAATIVVHGDHGMGWRVSGGELHDDDDGSYRTLLLIKPAGGRGPLRVSPRPATLLDVAPTLLESAGLPPDASFEGQTLNAALVP